jgi:hypothetical protein
MNTVELLQHSLDNAFGILGQVTADLTQEQADWQPPGTANPIGATYWHALSGADDVVYRWALGQEPIRQRDGWDDRVLTVALPEPEPGGDMQAYMRTIRVDLPAVHDYARTVAQALQEWLGSLAPEDLERVIHTPIGEHTLAHMLDLFVVWHLNAHCGEISALKGCQGAKGYPF